MAMSTDLPPGNIVSRMVSAEIGTDLSYADLKMLLSSGALTLRFPSAVLSQVTSKLSEINLYLESRSATQTGHLAIHASDVLDVTVGAPAGGNRVILSVKGVNNVAYHFAMPLEVASRLRLELRRAVQSAEQQSKQTRQ